MLLRGLIVSRPPEPPAEALTIEDLEQPATEATNEQRGTGPAQQSTLPGALAPAPTDTQT